MTNPQTLTGPLVRPRPHVHFTAKEGWINDPYGIAWVNGRYHLYYQAVPGQVVWGPNCHWGHAVSVDLVHWEERPLALVPEEYEVGCWSGSVVHTMDPPTIFYTRVTGENWDMGQVATASFQPADDSWRTGPDQVLIEGPPEDLGVRCFRDPFVFRHGTGWVLLMAAALPDDTAAVLQYRSDDLRSWTYDGVLCSRRGDAADEVWTGSLWECPQLFPMGDQWVLLVSVWDDSTLHYVAAAVGDYDGRRFQPRSWQRLTYGASAYAMSAFTDRVGRRCVMSWLREEPQNNPALAQRAGAHSVVSTLQLDHSDKLVMRPHPELEALRQKPLAGTVTSGVIRYSIGDSAAEFAATVGSGWRLEIADREKSRALISCRPENLAIQVERPGFTPQQLPITEAAEAIRVLVDADILEIFMPDRYGAYRITPSTDPDGTELLVSTKDTAPHSVRPLTGA